MFASCFNEAIIEESQYGNAGIVLDLSSVVNTKALETTSVDYEAYVNHVDVFIFGTQKNKDGDDVNLHYERLQFDVTGEGSKMLDVKKAWFTKDESYDVYVIANSTITEDKFKEDVKEVSDIWELTQEDLNLHLTGLPIDDVPAFFLMEGRGYTDEGKTEAVLNDGNAATNVEVKAELSRAAAKIVVELTAGTEVKYLSADNESVYYYRNLPYNTVVVEAGEIGYEISPKLNTSDPSPINGRVDWTVASDETNGKVVITGYAYAYSWTELDKETSLIVNIPMLYDENGDKVFDADENSSEIHAVNYYKIPLSKDKKFDRNHVYKVAATVNAPGSSTGFDPIEIKELKYDAYEWTKIWPDINVGGETNKPKYLQLNTYHVDMYNVNVDSTTLEFASSSYIPLLDDETTEWVEGITLKRAYYIDAYDNEINLSTNDKYDVYESINAVAEQSVLNGGITITSPFVGISDEEIVAQIGSRPSVPEMPQVPVNPEAEEVPNPGTQAEYAAAMSQSEDDFPNPTNGDTYYTYRYNNGRFQRQTVTYNWRNGWQSGSWRNYDQMQTDYNNALAAWEKWDDWNSLNEAEKANAIAQYLEDSNTYQVRLEEYNAAVAALEQYNLQYQAMSGDSHSNAIRYLEFEVCNATGQTATFTVAQYPTLYITNEHGYYSYRSDFGGTTYLTRGNPNRASVNWSNSGWTYSSRNPNNASNTTYFFGSKVALTEGDGYTINYYNWPDSGSMEDPESINGLNNPRMYHVHVTATSGSYIVGKPRLDASGFTESSADNTKLVSPSFMIASQLGATLTPTGGITQARQHCKEYIEVTTDGDIYDDWRLPTAAEIDIIINHQDVSDAMVVVLTGWAYYCAYNTDDDGNVIYYKETGKSSSNTAVRCIRDAY